MFIADAHLDLAYNVWRGRDITRPAAVQPPVGRREMETATVGLPDLRRAGVGLVCATLFCEPQTERGPGYTDHAGARAQADEQIEIYEDLCQRGLLRLVGSRGELPSDAAAPDAEADAEAEQTLAAIVLMEGADAMTLAEESDSASAAGWFAAGVRMVGLSWGRTRYAGGTGAPGPLTSEGRRLVAELDAAGMIHDCSHLSEESLDEVLDLAGRPLCASHSNCRALLGEDARARHLLDRHLRAITARGGVVGVVLYDRFLLPAPELEQRRATWADVVRHIDHICQLAGDCEHVGLGSDLDGGFGREHVPVELTTAADLPGLAEALYAAGYSDEDVRRVMGLNWLRFFERGLPE